MARLRGKECSCCWGERAGFRSTPDCMQHSKGTSVKWYASFPSSKPHPASTCVFFSHFSLSKCLLPQTPISISTIQALQLTNLLFIVAQRLLCSSLWHACCPLSRSCSGSLHSSPSPTFSPRPSSPLPDCNNVSKCGSACCWMETLFYTTYHLSNPQLGAGEAEARGSALTLLWWEGRRPVLPAGPYKQPFSASISHTGDGKHTLLVCL